MAEEPKIDWKALEAITKKVLAFKPKKKPQASTKTATKTAGGIVVGPEGNGANVVRLSLKSVVPRMKPNRRP